MTSARDIGTVVAVDDVRGRALTVYGRGGVRLALVAAIIGLLAGVHTASADHLQSCAIQNYSWGQKYEGTDAQNHCTGGTGVDDMYGYGAHDELNAGTGNDGMRGAHGSDTLLDTTGSSDRDRACLGDGADFANVYDDDPDDTVWDVPFPDGEADDWNKNDNDNLEQHDISCPIQIP